MQYSKLQSNALETPGHFLRRHDAVRVSREKSRPGQATKPTMDVQVGGYSLFIFQKDLVRNLVVGDPCPNLTGIADHADD